MFGADGGLKARSNRPSPSFVAFCKDDSAEPQYIETVPGHGYRFVAQVLIPGPNSNEQDDTPPGVGLESHSPADQISVTVLRPNALFARPVQNIVAWCAAGLFVCIAAIVIGTHLREPQIGSAVITGNMLTVKDANGNLLWTFPFDATIRPTPTTDPNWRAQVVDFNGDGKSEVLVAVDFLNRSEQHGDTKLFCFSARGKLLWTYRPEADMEFNTRDLNGPWVFHAMLLVDEGKSKSVWVAVGHQIWWPAFIVRISPDGSPETVFASSGIISTLQNVRTKSGTYVLAGGINNEYRMASVAVLASHPVPATSPQSDGSKYQCIRGCPGGRPFRYILLPRSEMNAASEVPYNDVSGMVIGPHGVTIQTREMAAASQFFDFSEEFRPERGYFF